MSRLLSAPELDQALAILERMKVLRESATVMPISSISRWKKSLEFVRLGKDLDALLCNHSANP